MKICMMTNTYLPHVGGVARSVSTFAEEYKKLGNKVLVIAPNFDGAAVPKKQEAIVERVAAIQNFNGSDFSVRLPLATALSDRIDLFEADIIHAHHPFLLGDTALRVAAGKNVPVIFTHHTRYEDYVHYVPYDSPALKKAAVNLSTEFANLCDGVIAPSESLARLIRRRGVKAPIAVVPTGIDVKSFAKGNGARFRKKFKIPANAFVVGHIGRLAPEKNLAYLAESVALALKKIPNSRFLVVGGGPDEEKLRGVFQKHGIEPQLTMAGKHTGRSLHDAYRAMDIFAFSSFSETQGMVIAEAMAAGLPVVALNASGVREVVQHGVNGYLLPERTPSRTFAAHIIKLHGNRTLLKKFSKAASKTSLNFSREHCAELALAFYEKIRQDTRRQRLVDHLTPLGTVMNRISIEWEILARNARTLTTAIAS
ncbi:glycosyltransferase [Oleiharenicola lentus]|uniref:glycosyltransferase n=1 Tax=Oleiharenicola lentus TaxID=2508720 RepID=UPI003F6772FA